MKANQYRFRKPIVKEQPKEFDYTKFIPIGTAMLILLGVSRLIFYYLLFNVNIIPFLDFSEIITSFLNIVVAGVLMLVLCVIIIFYIAAISILFPKSPSWVVRKRILVTLASFTISLAFLTAAWTMRKENRIIEFVRDTPKAILLPSILVFLLLFFFYFFYKAFTKQNQRVLIGLIVFFLLAEVSLYTVSIYNHQEFVSYGKNWGTTIVFNNDTFMQDSSHVFVSDSTSYFIGKTNNYILIHYHDVERTNVYPMSAVKEINFETNY